MTSLFRTLPLCAMLFFSGMATVSAAEDGKQTLEQRLQRLERILQNQSLADLVMQLQQLRQEVQQLRGEMELQKHTMDAMSRRQRDLYLDIDQRLSRFQPDSAVAAPPPAAKGPSVLGQPVTAVAEPGPGVAAPGGAVTPVAPPDPKQEASAYQSAFNLLKQGRYKASITAFSNFLRDYPGGSYEDNAQYWLAEASYVNRDFDTALGDFSKVVENHPQSPKIPGAMLKMGYIHYEKQDWDAAKQVLRELQDNYPASTEARLAEKRLQRITKEGR
ncbi:MAG: tol-pal system protein YbgF [Candidatus Thiodiazotropha sp. (ex Epidulcina cf. delphinae)]|nr:tol-pal system protein YbgF [Candidatus Thiodiazotropha sp. (ex Epidulcina cf. delphinae)]